MEEGQTTARDHPEAWLFGVRFDLFTREELRAWTRATLEGPNETRHIAFTNAEFVLEARRNERLRRYLNGCDLNFVDSAGVRLGRDDAENGVGQVSGHALGGQPLDQCLLGSPNAPQRGWQHGPPGSRYAGPRTASRGRRAS